MSNAIQNGSAIKFVYRGETRFIEVENVRQIGNRTLIVGYDVNKKGFRSFYRDEMENLVWVTQ